MSARLAASREFFACVNKRCLNSCRGELLLRRDPNIGNDSSVNRAGDEQLSRNVRFREAALNEVPQRGLSTLYGAFSFPRCHFRRIIPLALIARIACSTGTPASRDNAFLPILRPTHLGVLIKCQRHRPDRLNERRDS